MLNKKTKIDGTLKDNIKLNGELGIVLKFLLLTVKDEERGRRNRCRRISTLPKVCITLAKNITRKELRIFVPNVVEALNHCCNYIVILAYFLN